VPTASRTLEERRVILELAEEQGDKPAAEAAGVSESTIRTWRRREKMVDHRARDSVDAAGFDVNEAGSLASTGGVGAMIADLVDVAIATDAWDPGAGQHKKESARARAVEKFDLGGQFVSEGELRQLRAPGTANLRPGDIILLGGERFARFGDALWVVAETGAKFMVRPGKIREGERLSEDRARVIAKTAADKPDPLVISPQERMRGWDSQPDPQLEWLRRQVEAHGYRMVKA